MSSPDSSIWIVHRDPGTRGALARILAGAPAWQRRDTAHDVILGHPHDTIFDTASSPTVVVLGLGSLSAGADFEDELEFARYVSEQRPACAFILIAERPDLPTAGALFDTLDARLLPHPCDGPALLRAMREATDRRITEPLSQRAGRDRLAARFSRWFGRDEPVNLARALDARQGDLPILTAGEPGTGRALILRYAQAFSAGRPGPLLRLACRGATRGSHLLEQLDDAIAEVETGPSGRSTSGGLRHQRFGIWLEDLDALPLALQHRVLEWVEFGVPQRLLGARARWLASIGTSDGTLEPELERVFGELRIDLAPLRERPEVIEAFAGDTARVFSTIRNEPQPRFSPEAFDALRREPWPGNLAELEAVVNRTLAHLGRDARHVGVEDLRFVPERATVSLGAPPAQPDGETPDDVSSPRPEQAAATRDAATPRAAAPTGHKLEVALDRMLEPEHDPRERAEESAVTPGSVRRLAGAVAHEILNPLVPIRTLSELLPEHWGDEDFRNRFANLVGGSVKRIEEVVEQLQDVAELGAGEPVPVDVTALLETLLDAERERIQMRRLLVLKEFDRGQPHALGSERALGRALAGLISAALDQIPDNGDFYLASRHHPASNATGHGAPKLPGATLRILLRYPTATSAPPDPTAEKPASAAPSLRDTVLDHAVAEVVVRNHGGHLSIDNTDAAETVVLLDLPAPD